MRHLKKGRIFGRERNLRRALMRGLASSFFIKGRIRTTEAKAKELRPFVEKFITRAKDPTLASRRLLTATFSPAVAQHIITRAAGMHDRKGGYTRIMKIGARKSDSARMAIIEFV